MAALAKMLVLTAESKSKYGIPGLTELSEAAHSLLGLVDLRASDKRDPSERCASAAALTSTLAKSPIPKLALQPLRSDCR